MSLLALRSRIERTAFRLVARFPAPQSFSSQLAAARRAFTPRASASLIPAITVRGRRCINSLLCLRLRRSGRRLLGPRHSVCRPHAHITELWPNPAFERTRRFRFSTWRALARRAGYLALQGLPQKSSADGLLVHHFSCFDSSSTAFDDREDGGLRNYNRSRSAQCRDPDERRAPGPQSLVGMCCFPCS